MMWIASDSPLPRCGAYNYLSIPKFFNLKTVTVAHSGCVCVCETKFQIVIKKGFSGSTVCVEYYVGKIFSNFSLSSKICLVTAAAMPEYKSISQTIIIMCVLMMREKLWDGMPITPPSSLFEKRQFLCGKARRRWPTFLRALKPPPPRFQPKKSHLFCHSTN